MRYLLIATFCLCSSVYADERYEELLKEDNRKQAAHKAAVEKRWKEHQEDEKRSREFLKKFQERRKEEDNKLLIKVQENLRKAEDQEILKKAEERRKEDNKLLAEHMTNHIMEKDWTRLLYEPPESFLSLPPTTRNAKKSNQVGVQMPNQVGVQMPNQGDGQMPNQGDVQMPVGPPHLLKARTPVEINWLELLEKDFHLQR